MNFVMIFPENFKDNVTINIMVTKNCINSKEKKERIQLLKNQLEAFKAQLKIANGDNITNTLIIIKRIEYENIREIRPTLQRDFNNPDKEKTSREFSEIEINSVTNVLKEISLEIKLEPTSCKDVVIKSVILINCSQIK